MGTRPNNKMPGSDKMTSQMALMADGYLISPNGEFKMLMQGDGNLVLYNADMQPLWATGTNGEYGTHCIFQKDGHFVLYKLTPEGNVSTDPADCVFHTDIFGDPETFHGGWCQMQDDGNFVQYDLSGRPLWCTRTDGGQQGATDGGIDKLI